MKICALIQTRFNSTRLPGKALMDLNGMPVIQHIYRRLLGCRMVDSVAYATGISGDEDSALPHWEKARLEGHHFFLSPESDLVGRMLYGGRMLGGSAILRITGDCWAHDPRLLDDMIRFFLDGYPHIQGVCNWNPRTYSEGVDAEIYTMELLNKLDKDPNCPREGFATYAVAHGMLAKWPPPLSWDAYKDTLAYRDLHTSIDTQADLDLARKVLAKIGNDEWNYWKTMEAYYEVR